MSGDTEKIYSQAQRNANFAANTVAEVFFHNPILGEELRDGLIVNIQRVDDDILINRPGNRCFGQGETLYKGDRTGAEKWLIERL